ncbi:MAG: Hsp20 family protein [Gammaproteobacteria bacterium]|nr:Hsp20 family protein [Gammaproteobacteria bacterium]MDH5802909.1 Hsp20 family protein [Gammaproteobacteria bacterium]
MTTFDLSPLYRSSIGFDHLFSLLDNANRLDGNKNTYPPYNIEMTGEDKYRITMAVAGFKKTDVNIVSEQNNLTVTGKQSADDKKKYLHQGIAARSFERKFQLEDHVKVVSAAMEDGLLHIDLVREIPEAMKPRTIEIESNDRLIESKVEEVA